mgnify:CR=1 FL=1
MVTIIDYGMGNLRSVQKACELLGEQCVITGEAQLIARAEKLILPGVGAFGQAIECLKADGLAEAAVEAARKGVPLLGICLGMQLLFETSYEGGVFSGLGLIPGEITRFEEGVKCPHMGWNSLQILRDDPLFRHVRDGEYVYYVHSFYARDCAESTLATSQYGNVAVTGVVRRGNVYGTQFHPEKSGDTGLRLLRAFAEL